MDEGSAGKGRVRPMWTLTRKTESTTAIPAKGVPRQGGKPLETGTSTGAKRLRVLISPSDILENLMRINVIEQITTPKFVKLINADFDKFT